jgi:hypothetical protein
MKTGGNMHDLTGWVEIDCLLADGILFDSTRSAPRPSSSLTDPEGEYGEPVTYTEWADGDVPRLRTYLYPAPRSECRHYVPEVIG